MHRETYLHTVVFLCGIYLSSDNIKCQSDMRIRVEVGVVGKANNVCLHICLLDYWQVIYVCTNYLHIWMSVRCGCVICMNYTYIFTQRGRRNDNDETFQFIATFHSQFVQHLLNGGGTFGGGIIVSPRKFLIWTNKNWGNVVCRWHIVSGYGYGNM